MDAIKALALLVRDIIVACAVIGSGLVLFGYVLQATGIH
jgi:hypothetical protein